MGVGGDVDRLEVEPRAAGGGRHLDHLGRLVAGHAGGGSATSSSSTRCAAAAAIVAPAAWVDDQGDEEGIGVPFGAAKPSGLTRG